MNDQASPRGRLDEDGSGSPKRKKVRSKYTPRACVACRRSKLKCSGENPCLRCLDNGRRCFYSEDQTAAEALQNLSRPTPARPPPPPSVTSNGNGAPRRSILPRNDVMERRGSDASVLGLSMEARMARIEGMMESLIQDRYAGMNPRSSSEIEDVTMDEYNGEAMAQANMDAFAASLVPVRAPPPAIPRHVAHLPQHQSVPANNAFDRVEDAPTVRHGGRDLHFPDPEDYQRYISAFFRDLNKYYPCVNETLFRSQSDAMLASTTINDDYTCHLALTYIIFACMDVLGDAARSGLRGRPAGWQWFQLADGLVDKRKFSGRGDLGLVQCLVFQALYLMFFDQPEAAYTTIGLACRLCYQFGLHKQIKGADYVLFDSQPRHRIFCVVYIVDSRISLSCARPSSMQSIDIDSPLFKEMDKLENEPNVILSDLLNEYLIWMPFAPYLASDQSETLSAAARKTQSMAADVLDAKIKDLMKTTGSNISFLVKSIGEDGPSDQMADLWRRVILFTSHASLRLLRCRPSMTSLTYDATTARHCATLAMNIAELIATVYLKVPMNPVDQRAQSEPLGAAKFHVVAALASALLTLCTLLLRDEHIPELEDDVDSWVSTFHLTTKMLHRLAADYAFAARVARDFEGAIRVIEDILHHVPLPHSRSDIRSLRAYLPYQSIEAEDRGREGLAGDGGWDDEIQYFAPGKGVLWL